MAAGLILFNFCIVIFLLLCYTAPGDSFYILYTVENFNWICSWPFVLIKWEFYIDSVTLWMLFAINGISALVHLYSLDYMKHDLNQVKFMSYLSLFTFFMVMLVVGNNFLLLFLGWEGVGLCSFLLISFWHTRVQANKAAMKALIVNRVADFFLTLGIVFIYFVFKTFDFQQVFMLAPFFKTKSILIVGFPVNVLDCICGLLFLGAMGKSAQIGLHTWLPDAMEGPTPVSALIHAATMVTAGVFLLIKCSFMFEHSYTVLMFVAAVGSLTAVFAATSALVQNDIKKVVAYSTCSQLGYMIFTCGLSNYHVGFFHLINHAVFKALLFLAAGSIIHSLSNEQDMRKYGGVWKLVPYSGIVLVVGSLALVGFPFTTGYYSKDIILETTYGSYTIFSNFCYLVGLCSAFFTSFYSYRVLYLSFIYKTNSSKSTIKKIHDAPFYISCALMILAVGSIYFGYVFKDLFTGLGSNFFSQSIFINPQSKLTSSEFIPHIIKLAPLFGTLLAICLANIFYFHNLSFWGKIFNRFYSFASYKWYFDVVYNRFINIPLLQFSRTHLFELGDKGIFEIFGPLGSDIVLSTGYKLIKDFMISDLTIYGFYIVLFVILSL